MKIEIKTFRNFGDYTIVETIHSEPEKIEVFDGTVEFCCKNGNFHYIGITDCDYAITISNTKEFL